MNNSVEQQVIRELTTENLRLKERISQIENDLNEINCFDREEILSRATSCDTLEATRAAERQKQLDSLSLLNFTLQAERSEYGKKTEELRSTIDELKRENIISVEKNGVLTKQIDDLRREVADLTREKLDQKRTITDLTASNMLLQSRVQKLEKLIEETKSCSQDKIDKEIAHNMILNLAAVSLRSGCAKVKEWREILQYAIIFFKIPTEMISTFGLDKVGLESLTDREIQEEKARLKRANFCSRPNTISTNSQNIKAVPPIAQSKDQETNKINSIPNEEAGANKANDNNDNNNGINNSNADDSSKTNTIDINKIYTIGAYKDDKNGNENKRSDACDDLKKIKNENIPLLEGNYVKKENSVSQTTNNVASVTSDSKINSTNAGSGMSAINGGNNNEDNSTKAKNTIMENDNQIEPKTKEN